MIDSNIDDFLLVDDYYKDPLNIAECTALKPIQKKFMESYIQNKDKVPLEHWLLNELRENLPEKSDAEISDIRDKIISTLTIDDEKKESLSHAIANGRSKESWFAEEMKKNSSHLTMRETSEYLQNLDNALEDANASLYNTITTKAGIVNLNPNLDGFIAEQHHAQTFNLNAEASGSQYRAKVLQPEHTRYTKNSVDIVVVDGNDKVVRRYQSKYCKDTQSTIKAFEDGNYKGQQKLVPEDQSIGVQKKHAVVIEAPDGTTSTPLSKSTAKKLQKEAQSGNWNDLNWNEYRTKDVAIGIGKQAGQSALMGAVIGAGFEMAQKVWNGEEINGSEVIEAALSSSADFGIKAAAAGALKVGAEKGIISVIPKGTPADTIANIAYVGIENAKIAGKIAAGDLSLREGVDKMEQTTVSTVSGLSASLEGAELGAGIGAIAGPVGSAVCGFVGGTVGYMAGSKFGESVVKCAQTVRDKIWSGIKSFASTAFDAVSSVCDGIMTGLASLLDF